MLCTIYQVMCGITSTKKRCPNSKVFWLGKKKAFQIILISMKILTKDILLSKYKLDFAHIPVYSADSANVKKKKKKERKGLTCWLSCTLCTQPHFCGVQFASLWDWVTFQFLVNRQSTYKDFWPDGVAGHFLCHRLTRCLTLLYKCWPAISSYFPTVRPEEWPCLVWKYTWDENGEKG